MAKSTKPSENIIDEKAPELTDEMPPEIPELIDEEIAVPVHEQSATTESGEISFLRHLLFLQHSGGWGKHLDPVINGRIKELQSV